MKAYGKRRHIYTFENICKEDNQHSMGDEAVKLLLNVNDIAKTPTLPHLKHGIFGGIKGEHRNTMMNQVIEHYDLLIEEGNDPVHDPKPLQDYMDKWDGQDFIDKLKLDKAKAVLEIGVGTGRLAIKVAPLCGCFFGIDISSKTIERAKDNLANWDNVTLFCGDFTVYSFPQTFDVIYSSLTFMHIKEKQTALNKVECLLKDDGRFVLSIDKNQERFIGMGSRKIPVFPDDPHNTESYIKKAGLMIIEQSETEFAHIFVAVKS